MQRSTSHLLSILIALVLLHPVATCLAAGNETELKLPSFGLTIPMPSGYTRGLEKTPWVACRFEVLDAKGNSQHLISIQIAKLSAGQTSEQVAISLAGPKGKVQKAKWGNLDSLEVQIDSAEAKSSWYPARHMIADHDGFSYLLTYAVEIGHEDFKAYDDVAAKTVWSARSLANAVSSRNQTIAFERGLSADLPDPFRRDDKSSKPGAEVFVVTDFAVDKPAMKLLHISQLADAGATLDQAINGFPLKPQTPATWRKIGDGKVAISSTFNMLALGDLQGIVTIDAHNIGHFFMFITPTGAGDAKPMNQAAEILAGSIVAGK